jgi:hypothetical protein
MLCRVWFVASFVFFVAVIVVVLCVFLVVFFVLIVFTTFVVTAVLPSVPRLLTFWVLMFFARLRV